jgi:predicted dehydrogenase
VKSTLKFAIIGSGAIAAEFARALQSSRRCHVVNVLGSAPNKGAAFAHAWSLPRYSASIDELLNDASVEAVYVASPHPCHEMHALACIEAGRPVLCEKPLTVDRASSERLIATARARGVFLMEAYMYRCHPLLARALELLDGGAIGQPRHVRSSFGYRTTRDPEDRRFNLALGGGAILDVGGYPVSLARLIAGRATGASFAEPSRVQALRELGPTGSDELAVALLRFESGITAQVACATRHQLGTESVVYGEEGRLELPDVWLPRGQRQGLEGELILHREGRAPELIRVSAPLPTFAIEAELVADTLPALEAASPAMNWADTLGNMRVLDEWRRAIASS